MKRSFTSLLASCIVAFSLSAQVTELQRIPDAKYPGIPLQTSFQGSLYFVLDQTTADVYSRSLWQVNADGELRRLSATGERVATLDTLNGRIVYTLESPDGAGLILKTYAPATAQTQTLGFLSSAEKRLCRTANTLYFGNNRNNVFAPIWQTDGATVGSLQTPVGQVIATAVTDQGAAFFSIIAGATGALYAASGNQSALILQGQASDFIPQLFAAGPYVFWVRNNALWRSYGSQADIQELKTNFPELPVDWWNVAHIAHQGILYLELDGIWRSDGTPGGTYMIGNQPVESFFIDEQTVKFIRSADAPDFRPECWRCLNNDVILETTFSDQGISAVSTPAPLRAGGILMHALKPGFGAEPLIYLNKTLHAFDIWKGNGDSYRSWTTRPFAQGEQTDCWMLAESQYFGQELWRIQPHGPAERMTDLGPGARWSDLWLLSALEGHLYFLHRPDPATVAVCRIELDAPGLPPTPPVRDYEWMECLAPMDEFPNNSLPRYLGSDMVLTRSGAVYLGGYADRSRMAFLNDTLQQTLFSPDYQPVQLVARLDSAGHPRWMQTLGGNPNLAVPAVKLAEAPSDGLYAGGMFEGLGRFGNLSLVAPAQHLYLCRIDAAGNALWAIQADIGDRGELYKLCSDAEGRVLIGGVFSNKKADFGAVTLENNTDYAYFIMWYNANGQALAGMAFSIPDGANPRSRYAFDACLAGQGQAWVAMGFGGYNTSQSCAFQPYTMQVVQADLLADEVQWAHTFYSDDLSFPTGITASENGIVRVTGRFRGDLDLGRLRLKQPCETGGISNKGGAGFVVQLNTAGKVLSAQKIDDGDVSPSGIQSGPDGTYFLTGYQDGLAYAPYPGYFQTPFQPLNGRQAVFVRQYSPDHRLLKERRFYRLRADWDERMPIARLDATGHIVLHDLNQYGFGVDTLGQAAHLGQSSGAVVLKFDFAPASYLETPADQALEEAAILLAPNPAGELLTVFSADADFSLAQVELFDIAGRKIDLPVQFANPHFGYISVSALPAGVYVLSLRWQNKWISKRWVKD